MTQILRRDSLAKLHVLLQIASNADELGMQKVAHQPEVSTKDVCEDVMYLEAELPSRSQDNRKCSVSSV